MIKQVFQVENYWEVIVFYSVDYNFFDDVILELRKIDFSLAALERARKKLMSGEAKALTCSNEEQHTSVVVFNTHSSKADYINSIVHEAEHVKQAMLKAYRIEDKGELPAYTVGYIVMRMYETFKNLLLV